MSDGKDRDEDEERKDAEVENMGGIPYLVDIFMAGGVSDRSYQADG